MTFRARLVLGAAYLLTAVVVALEVPLALNAERRATSEFQSAVLGNVAVLGGRIADLVAAASAAPNAAGPERRRIAALVREATVAPGARVVVADAEGRLLADTAGTAPVGEPFATPERPELRVALFEGTIDTRRRASETLGEELLLVTVPVVDDGQVVGAVRGSAPLDDVRAGVRETRIRLALIGLGVVLAGLVLAYLLAGTLARPLEALAAAAGRLGRGDLGTRVEPSGPPEVAEVGTSFNRMAAALGANLAAQRDFVANASHQLRTPLTGLKLRLEAIRAEGGPAAEQAAKAEAELDRLSELVDDLLALARASSLDATGRTVDVRDVVRAAAERWAQPAAEAGHELLVAAEESASVWADPGDLAHIVDNAVENAIHYTPPGTRITLESRTADGRAELAVADDGPGIPPGERGRVFERFYRGSNGRQAGPGTGLGLAIVAELAERWQGEVRLGDGPGTRVEAAFPAVDAQRGGGLPSSNRGFTRSEETPW